MRSPAERAKPQPRDHSVLTHQRDDVCQRADGCDLDEGRQPALASRACAQRLNELQGDADARQVFIRIAAVVALGVDHRQRVRQIAVRLVMVGDDEIDSEFARASGCLGGANSAVDRNDERHALGVQPLDRCRLQPVTVAQTLGNEVNDFAAEQLERPPQDDGRRDAVDVIVAMYGDALLAREGLLDPRHRFRHPHQPERVVQVSEAGVQKALGFFRIAQAAHAEQPRHGGMEVEGRGQGGRLAVIAWQVLPDEGFHGMGFSSAFSVSMNAVPSVPIRRNFS